MGISLLLLLLLLLWWWFWWFGHWMYAFFLLTPLLFATNLPSSKPRYESCRRLDKGPTGPHMDGTWQIYQQFSYFFWYSVTVSKLKNLKTREQTPTSRHTYWEVLKSTLKLSSTVSFEGNWSTVQPSHVPEAISSDPVLIALCWKLWKFSSQGFSAKLNESDSSVGSTYHPDCISWSGHEKQPGMGGLYNNKLLVVGITGRTFTRSNCTSPSAFGRMELVLFTDSFQCHCLHKTQVASDKLLYQSSRGASNNPEGVSSFSAISKNIRWLQWCRYTKLESRLRLEHTRTQDEGEVCCGHYLHFR